MYTIVVQSTTKSILIIGGTSSLAENLIRVAKEESFDITATFRGCLENELDDQIHWMNLELSEIESIERFLINLGEKKFDKVFFLIGAVTNKYFLEMTHIELLKYYSSYVANSVYLLQKCFLFLKTTSRILVMSSRAGTNVSYDVHYSSMKSALEAFVRSSSKALTANQSIIGISSGLIENSRMYLDMKPEHRISHKIRAGGSLITVEDLCSEIWLLSSSQSTENNGHTIHVGPIY